MNKKLLLILVIFLLATLPFAYAENTLTPEQIEQTEVVLNRFEEINDILLSDYNLLPKEKAKLYYEKAMIMFTDSRFLITPTVCLLNAVELDPDNKKYKDLLRNVYNEAWKDMELTGDDPHSQDFLAIQKAIKLHFFAETYTVKRVIDGDTLELANGETIRLIGIDIPEADTKEATEVKNFIKSLVEGKEVTLEFDVQERDKYGRLSAYVYVPVHSYSYIARDEDGNLPDFNPWDVADSFLDEPKGMGVLPELLNAYIIRNGYASPMTIPPNVKYAELFEKFYREAREKKRGLWR